MDPNTALTNARMAARVILSIADDVDALSPELGIAVELAEAFQSLDNWISAGGYLPTSWTEAVR